MRLRVVQYVVQPVIVADDGESLTPVEAAPITVSAAAFPEFPADFLTQLAKQEDALNAEQAP